MEDESKSIEEILREDLARKLKEDADEKHEAARKTKIKQWAAIGTTVIVAVGNAYLSRDHALEVDKKSTMSEDEVAKVVEGNSKAISVGVKALEQLQQDRVKLEQEFRFNVIALQEAVREVNQAQQNLALKFEIEKALREDRDQARTSGSSRSHADPDMDQDGVPDLEVPPPSPAVEALTPPHPVIKADEQQQKQLRDLAKPLAMERVWSKD